MAVAQGYGKTVTSGSVFAYDVADTRNSYIGQPTTNLVLFNVTVANFNNDYGANLVSQTADYNITYRGRPSVRVISVGQWNLYRAGRPGNFTATSSTIFTFSWKMKWADGKVPSFVVGYIYTDADYFYPGVTVTPLEDGWYLCQTTGGGTSSPVWLAGFNSSQTGTCYVTDWQVETKSYATQFTTANTTRSATQGLLPLVGNSTIDLTNVSFDSNAQITFDGTNDYIDLGYAPFSGTGAFTIETVYTLNTTDTHTLIGNYPASSLQFMGRYGLYINGSCYFPSSLGPGTYYAAATRDGSGTCKLYLNGVLVNTATNSTNIGTNSFRMGTNTSGGEVLNGKIPVMKLYNRGLSGAEIRQNYLHYKTRFNLS
jgi:hypothetical protein